MIKKFQKKSMINTIMEKAIKDWCERNISLERSKTTCPSGIFTELSEMLLEENISEKKEREGKLLYRDMAAYFYQNKVAYHVCINNIHLLENGEYIIYIDMLLPILNDPITDTFTQKCTSLFDVIYTVAKNTTRPKNLCCRLMKQLVQFCDSSSLSKHKLPLLEKCLDNNEMIEFISNNNMTALYETDLP